MNEDFSNACQNVMKAVEIQMQSEAVVGREMIAKPLNTAAQMYADAAPADKISMRQQMSEAASAARAVDIRPTVTYKFPKEPAVEAPSFWIG